MNDVLTALLTELESNRLEVVKVPSRDGWKRVVCSANAQWYQRLCAAHARPRRRYPKIRTYIKRQLTVAALRRMLAGDRDTVYARRILDLIHETPELADVVNQPGA